MKKPLRNPYRVLITIGWEVKNGKVIQKRKTLGYFSSRKKANEALVSYNENPYDLDADKMTFEELYEKWSEEHFKTLANKSSMRSYRAAFNYSKTIHKMKIRDIKVRHIEKTIEDSEVGSSTKARMKVLYNLMFRYAMKHELIDKNYAELCSSVKVEKKTIRVPFSKEEISLLWENRNFPFVDIVLFGIYTGFRPIEIALIKTANINFELNYIVGGIKTKAGRDRKVPIHPMIKDIVLKYFGDKNEFLFNDYNKLEHKATPLSYDKLRNRFRKIMKFLKMDHTPHEMRHTFITQAKECGVNEYVLKLIVGHEIDDVTENVYTHRDLENLQTEMRKVDFFLDEK